MIFDYQDTYRHDTYNIITVSEKIKKIYSFKYLI